MTTSLTGHQHGEIQDYAFLSNFNDYCRSREEDVTRSVEAILSRLVMILLKQMYLCFSLYTTIKHHHDS
eukprot:scaffold633_cov288-Ochromonas_danica.AAC.13